MTFVSTPLPPAHTRMTDELLPDEAKDLLKPEEVTPGVLYLVSKDGPTGIILDAGAGVFAVTRILETEGVWLAPEDRTPEEIAENFEEIRSGEGQRELQNGNEQSMKFIAKAMEGVRIGAKEKGDHMTDAAIVSVARTPIGKAYRGAFNNLEAPSLGAIPIKASVERAGVDPSEVDDVIMGCAMPQGTQFPNIGRLTALAAGLPTSVAGMTIDRQCSSGLMSVATAAKQIMYDGMDIVVAGGVESISLAQNEHTNTFRMIDPTLVELHPAAYMPMLQTAEVVSERFDISREAQDEYGLQSQERTAAGQESGAFDDEIVPGDREETADEPRDRRGHV